MYNINKTKIAKAINNISISGAEKARHRKWDRVSINAIMLLRVTRPKPGINTSFEKQESFKKIALFKEALIQSTQATDETGN